jgi:autotransporter family porin
MGNNIHDKILSRIFFCLLFLSLLFLFSLTIGIDSAAPVVYVNHATGKNIWDGQSPVWNGTSGPKATIQNAINIVNTKGTVNVAAGTYNEHLKITKSIKLIGQKQSRTIIDGNHSGTVIYVSTSVSLRILNLTILNGKALNGGGIYNKGNCSVTNCTITNNSAKNGAGIINYNGICTFTNCNFNNNTSSGDGGSILNYCMINVSSHGFGACVLNLNGCRFVGNVAGGDGGVISNHGVVSVGGHGFGACVLNLNGCRFVGNVAGGDGGVISNHEMLSDDGSQIGACVLNFHNCIFVKNYAGRDGGAILNLFKINNNSTHNIKTSLNVNECTFTGNKAVGDGGAIWNQGTANMYFNRISGNNANRGNALYSKDYMFATNNWWGINYPNFDVLIFTTKGIDVLHTPWLYLTFRANPTIIPYGSNSILTANFNHHTDGKKITPINPVNGHIPDGSPVTFTTNLGNVDSKSIKKYTKQGLAYTIFHGDKGTGYTKVKLITDGQILYTTITIMPITNTSNTTEKTIGMQTTGVPIAPLTIGILIILTGLLTTRKKQ